MRKTFATAFKLIALSAIALATADANALPLVWRADWPGSKPVETLVHRGTDIEFQPQWYINGEIANSTNWTFTTFVQTNAQATGEWFGPLPGAAFSHTNDIGAAFYNVMIRAQMPGGGVNYTAFARLRMLDSPGYTPGELPLPVSTIDFSKVVALNAPWLLPAATNDLASIRVELGSNSVAIASNTAAIATNAAAIATNAAAIAANSAAISTNSAAIATNATAIAGVRSNLENNYYTASETDEAIDALAAYYITATAQGAAFATYAALTNATVYYSAGAVRAPTRNDYCVVLADETHGGAEWRYIYAVADGATTGQWEAQYPIETNDYEALSNKPQINGHTLTNNQTGAALGVLDLSGGTLTGQLCVGTSGDLTIIDPTTGVDAPLISAAQIKIAGITIERTGNSLTFLIADGNTVVTLPLANTGTAALVSDITAATNGLLRTEVDPIWTAEKANYSTTAQINAALAGKADVSQIRYTLTNITYAANVQLADRTITSTTIAAPGSGSTATATFTMPAPTTGKARDFMLNLTFGSASTDAGDINLTFVEPTPAGGTTPSVEIDFGSIEDVAIGKNIILFTEVALPTSSPSATHWLITVKHEDFAQ
jgi:hypothetical protein